MALRKLPFVVGLATLTLSGFVSALGLGELKLNSALNEPLDAEIRLLNVGDLSELELLAGLASLQDFERAGVDREFHLTGLQFTPDLAAPGGPIIRVTSKKPIQEPYLDFLVEVQWPSGRLLREYTLLLDLPLFAGDKTGGKPVAAARSAPSSYSAPSPEAQVAGPASRGTPDTGTSLPPGAEYRVESGDTLWKIAGQVQSGNATRQQTMVAIHELNPGAFINGDINLLRRGYVLRLPSGAEMVATDRREALSRIAGAASAADTAPQLTSTSRPRRTGESAAGEGQLRLAALSGDSAPADAASGSGNIGSDGDPGGTGQVPDNEVAAVQEELDRSQRENADLRQRLANLEEQLETMQRMVELSDDSARAAQLTMAADIAEEPVGPETETETVPDAGGTTTDAPNPEEVSGAQGETATPEVVGRVATAGENVVQTRQSPTILERLGEYIYYLLGALAAILLAVFALAARRRKMREEDEQLMPLAEKLSEPSFVFQEEDSGFSAASIEDIDIHDDDQLFDLDSADEDKREGLELEDEEQVDPLGEADIYISLGNFNEAEEVLQKALAKDSNDKSLHLKMLELYVAKCELENFDAYYASMKDLGDAAVEYRASEFRDELLEALGEKGGDTATTEPVAELPETDLELQPWQDETNESEIVNEIGESDIGENDAAANDAAADAGISAKRDEAAGEQPEEPSDSEATSPRENTLEFDLDLDMDSFEEKAGAEMDREGSESSFDENTAAAGDATSAAEEPLTDEGDDDTDLDALAAEMEGMPDLDTEPVATGDNENTLDDEFDLLGESDEAATKLELAQAYIDMGDPEGAREILQEVVDNGDREYQEKARELLGEIA